MSYPKPKMTNSEIDLKLGIKSSLPNATQAIVLAYLIWKCNDKKAKIIYSEQSGDRLILQDEVSTKISEFLSKNIEYFNKTLFEKEILNNPLLKAQIEALIVGFELVWKLARFQFVDGSSFSAERTGGKRFEKIILYTLNVDILDLLVQSNEKAFLQFFYEILTNSSVSNQKIFDSFRKLVTIFSETAIYKIEHDGTDLIFDNLGVYKSILEDNNVNLSDDKENKGASRILKSSATEGLNYYLTGSSGLFEKNTDLSENELKNYAERVENFLALTNIKITESNNQIVRREISINEIPFPLNRIIFGAPGTGKSYTLNKDSSNYFESTNIERVTFHPNYSYAQFVGTYKPTMESSPKKELLTEQDAKILDVLKDSSKSAQEKYDELYPIFRDDNSLTRLPILIGLYSDEPFQTRKQDGSAAIGDNSVERNHGKAIRSFVNLENQLSNQITYKYVPGPFMRVYAKAKQNPEQSFLLVIEEINRANVAAVFGEVFQLLDRQKDGTSEYPVDASEDIKQYLLERGIDENQLSLPNNMYIWATMNSADQGVFPMDTAFKRRWEFEYLGIDEGESEVESYELKYKKDGTSYVAKWNDIRKFINDRLIDLGINEDKLLGPFFIAKNTLENTEELTKVFKSKVLMYLFEDAAKMKVNQLFHLEDKKYIYSKICKAFDENGFDIFHDNRIDERVASETTEFTENTSVDNNNA